MEGLGNTEILHLFESHSENKILRLTNTGLSRRISGFYGFLRLFYPAALGVGLDDGLRQLTG